MKGIEFVLLAVGALAGTFLRYKIVSTPLWLGALPLNVLAINVLGSFALGAFSIVTLSWNLDMKYSLLVAIGFLWFIHCNVIICTRIELSFRQ